ncbi:MAG: hypothetical protein LBQ93_03840, partial [Treponema sp.]|nr:hypothetical protein [Treponema sp.]
MEIGQNIETIKFCGTEWESDGGHTIKSSNSNLYVYEGYLSNDKIGSIFITANAFRILNNDDNLHYKVISLIYELNSLNKMFSIGENEQDLLKGPTSNDDYISCDINTFIKKFPSDFMEIQHRVLLSLYRNYPNYGQFIRNVEEFHFFAKNNTELGFILDSLISKKLLEGAVLWNSDGTMRPRVPFKITVDGWHEIEKSLHKVYSNQIFVAMDFDKSFDTVRNSIKKAIDEAGFKPIV